MRLRLRWMLVGVLALAICRTGLALAAESADGADASGSGKNDTNWFTQKVRTAPMAAAIAGASAEAATAGATADSANREVFHVLPGFKVEHLFTVPKEQLGSWVSIAVDDKGRLLASDQDDKGLCRVTPPPIQAGDNADPSGETKVEHLKANISSAQGLLCAFGSLYASVNRGPRSGLYRLRDTHGSDQYDEVVKLKDLHGPVGEHGPHALRLSPDGKSILLMCGNHTDLPFTPAEMKDHPDYRSLLPANWDEDLILPRLWDPKGHARGRMAPGGFVARTDPDGKSWTMYSVGYRNCYDMDFNADGELITYDSDMEWDMGLPWYRATRLVHATPGSEYGWRSGAGDWPWYYVDSLPPMEDVGPGSPTGVCFGYGTKYPAKYQRAFFACDWTFGTIYAVHLEPEGSSYKAVKEEFLSRNALPLTDIVVGTDGALYFLIGGRKLQSELYRVTYVGSEATAPVDAHDARCADQRALRHKLEAYEGQPAADPSAAVEFVWPYLGHSDRFIRYAARVALEFQPVTAWQDRVWSASDPETVITAAVALAHQGDKTMQTRLLSKLNAIDFDKLTDMLQLDLLRAYELALVRFGPPSESAQAALIARLDKHYPSKNDLLNRELCDLLCNLQSPTVVAKTMPLLEQPSAPSTEAFGELLDRNRAYARPIEAMLEHHPDQQKIAYAYALRNVKVGWTIPQRQAFFALLRDASRWSGGLSFEGYLAAIDRDAFDSAPDKDRVALEALGAHKAFVVPPLPKPEGPGRERTTEEVVRMAQAGLHNRDFADGRKVFSAARCVICHRFGGDGGSTGPDLTQLAGRFNVNALAESIVEPSKVIADDYRSYTVVANGKQYLGRIVADVDGHLTIDVDPEDSTKIVQLARSEIESETQSPISLMPLGLLKPLNDNEVLNLMAYLLSRGNPQDPMFDNRQAAAAPSTTPGK